MLEPSFCMPASRSAKTSEMKTPSKNVVESGCRRPHPEPEAAMPDPPPELTADALAEWRRVAALHAELGILFDCDRASLATYCQSWGRWRRGGCVARVHHHHPRLQR